MLSKLKNWLKSFKFPGILSFSISKQGKINPTLEESLADAEPTNTWDRVGLGNKTMIGMPVWQVIAFPFAIWFLMIACNSILFAVKIKLNLLTVYLSTRVSENSLAIISLNFLMSSLEFLLGTFAKFLSFCLFAWVFYKIWISYPRNK